MKTGVLDDAVARLDSVQLTVLVLGPGRGADGYHKRRQIRRALNRIPGVVARFPEDRDLIELVRRKMGVDEKDVVALELAQGMVSDLILALDIAQGVNQEVAMFSTYSQLRGKICALVEERHRDTPSSFPGHVRRSVRQEFFTPAEFAECSLASRRCPAIATSEKVHRALR